MQGTVLAYGATGGMWRADGEDWQRIVDLELQSPIEVMVAVGSVLFAAAGAEIVALLDGTHWVTVATVATEQIIAMISDPSQAGQIWIATDHGSVWRVGVDGSAWCVPAVLAAGEHPIALALHKHAPVVATIDRSIGRVRIWQMDMASQRWVLWLECPTAWAGAQLLLTDTAPDLIAVGPRVWQREGTSWIAHDLDTTPILRLMRVPGSLQIIAVTEQHYFTTLDGVTWNSQTLAVPLDGLLDLAYVGSTPPQLIGLGPGGVVWSVDHL
jgi:hypothetical protein